MAVQRTPIFSAIPPMAIPPIPDPNQASAAASAGTERASPASAAISLSATVTIHGAPNAMAMMPSAMVATVHADRLSIECEEDCNIGRDRLQSAEGRVTLMHWNRRTLVDFEPVSRHARECSLPSPFPHPRAPQISNSI